MKTKPKFVYVVRDGSPSLYRRYKSGRRRLIGYGFFIVNMYKADRRVSVRRVKS